MKWDHNILLKDLAIKIGPTPYINCPLGSIVGTQMKREHLAMEAVRKRSAKDDYMKIWRNALNSLPNVKIADVMSVIPSYKRFSLSMYEVKVTRSDFLRDLRYGKWKGYLPHCHRLYFAVPSGMVKKEEIPEETGLIVRGPKGWKVTKPGRKRKVDIPLDTLLSLLFLRQRNFNLPTGDNNE